MWYDWMWWLRWKWRHGWWKQWWLRPVLVKRHMLGGQERSTVKWVPRVRFRWGIDYFFGSWRGVWVYWSPRKTAWEGEYLYEHYIRFTWPRLCGLDWQ